MEGYFAGGGIFFEFLLRGLPVDYYALAFVFGGDGILDHGVEGAEESVVADEEVGFAAQMVEHSCHFDRDVAGAYEGDFLGPLFKFEEAVGRDTQFAARDVFGNAGVAASGDENVLCTDSLFGAVVENYFYFVL